MKYKFLNLNPLGEIEEDCVTRAISLGINEEYWKVREKLELIAKLFECEELCVCCYHHLLDDVYKLHKISNCDGMTIEEFAWYHPIGTYILRVDGHLTCLIDNVLYDTWDCRKEIVDIAWKV